MNFYDIVNDTIIAKSNLGCTCCRSSPSKKLDQCKKHENTYNDTTMHHAYSDISHNLMQIHAQSHW